MAVKDCCSATRHEGWHISSEQTVYAAAMQASQHGDMLMQRTNGRAMGLCAVAEQDRLRRRRGARHKLSAQHVESRAVAHVVAAVQNGRGGALLSQCVHLRAGHAAGAEHQLWLLPGTKKGEAGELNAIKACSAAAGTFGDSRLNRD